MTLAERVAARDVRRHHVCTRCSPGADFGAGFWDLVAGRRRTGSRAARADRGVDRTGVGGESRVADLRARHAVDGVSRRVRADHVDAVRAAHAGRGRHHPARRRVRVPQGVGDAPAAPPVRRRRSRRRRCSRRSCSARSSAGSRRAGFPPASRPATSLRSWLNPTSVLGGVHGRGRVRVPRRGLPHRRRRAPGPARARRVLPAAGDRERGRGGRGRGSRACSCCTHDAPDLFHGLTHRGAPLIAVSAVAGAATLVLLLRGRVTAGRGSRPRSRSSRCCSAGPPGQYPYMLEHSLRISDAAGAHADARRDRSSSSASGRLCLVPALVWLFVLMQRGVLAR